MTTQPQKSWVGSANDHPDFPIQNLPLGIFSRSGQKPRGGVAIGDSILDLQAALEAGLFSGDAAVAAEAASGEQLNSFFGLGASSRKSLRTALLHLLDEHSDQQATMQALGEALLVPMSRCELHLPARVGDYTDFYVGIHHAQNIGSFFARTIHYCLITSTCPLVTTDAPQRSASLALPCADPTAKPSQRAKRPPASAPVNGWIMSWSWVSGWDRAITWANPSPLVKPAPMSRVSVC